MKKAIIILALFVTATSNAQVVNVDSVIKKTPDTLEVISAKDLNLILQQAEDKVSKKSYDIIQYYFGLAFQNAIIRRETKKIKHK